MHKSSLFLFIMIIGSTCFAQQVFSYPEEDPIYSIVMPKGFGIAIYDDYKVLEIYNKDESLVYSIYELETVLLYEAVQRAHREAETEFENHEFGVVMDEEINGIVFHKISGSGTTTEGELFNIEVRLFRLDNNNFFMIYYSGLPGDINYYQIELGAINNSIKKK